MKVILPTPKPVVIIPRSEAAQADLFTRVESNAAHSTAKFEDLNLIEPLLRGVQAEGYERATPIQTQAIPLVLARKDVLACAQTGTGKTAAFALPMLQLLAERKAAGPGRPIRALILTPTRELASQIADNFSSYGRDLNIRNTVIFGGVGQNAQVRALRQGVDVLIATPGRLIDLLQQRLVNLSQIEIFVLDEADRMLDMGFIHDVKRVIAVIPKQRQTLFFSATMPQEIHKLSEQILNKPVRIAVTPVATTAEKIQQAIYHVDKKKKTALLIHLLDSLNVQKGLVFTRTKRDANRVSDTLNAAGIRSAAIHGNKSQSARELALDQIKRGVCRVLVATDIAARGIDIDQVTHVFNHDIPNVPESYVHRIGRTARAGKEGVAFSLCAADERDFLRDIERLIRMQLDVFPLPDSIPPEPKAPKGAAKAHDSNASGDNNRFAGNRAGRRPSANNRANSRGNAPRFNQEGRQGRIQVGARSSDESRVRTPVVIAAVKKTDNTPAKVSVAGSVGPISQKKAGFPLNPPPSPNNRKKRREQRFHKQAP